MTDSPTWASPGSGVPADDGAGPESGREPGRTSPVVASPHAEPDEPDVEIPLRPLGVSEILDGAITSVRRSPRAALGMSAILTAVVQTLITLAEYFIIGANARSELTPSVFAESLGLRFIAFAGGLVLTAYVVLLLSGLLAPLVGRSVLGLGRALTLRQAWRDVRPVALRLLGVASLVMWIVVLALGLPLLPLIVAAALDAPEAVIVLCGTVGLPLAVVLMVTVYVWAALATPILVMERRGVAAALRRSAEIVRGRWWRVFGILLLALVITVFVGLIVLPVPFAIAERLLIGGGIGPSGGWTLIAVVALDGLGRIIAGTLTNPFNAGVIALLYVDRRMRREGFDLELQMNSSNGTMDVWLPGPLTAAGSGPQPKAPRQPLVVPHPPSPPWGGPQPPRGWPS